jgi:hypothetical protein
MRGCRNIILAQPNPMKYHCKHTIWLWLTRSPYLWYVERQPTAYLTPERTAILPSTTSCFRSLARPYFTLHLSSIPPPPPRSHRSSARPLHASTPSQTNRAALRVLIRLPVIPPFPSLHDVPTPNQLTYLYPRRPSFSRHLSRVLIWKE